MAEGVIIESCLHHKAEMVMFEASRAITELSNVTSLESTPAVTALQLLSSSYKPGLRFAAVQALNKVERFYYKFFLLGVCCAVYVMTIPSTFYQKASFPDLVFLEPYVS
jgi:hypothetical protein